MHVRVLAAVAFAVFGALLGLLIGMTSSSVVAGFLPLAFAFAGGSVIALLKGMDDKDRIIAFVALLFLSAGTITGVLSGIALTESQALTPRALRQTAQTGGRLDAVTRDERTYLRAVDTSFITSIDQQVREGQIDERQAYERIIEEANREAAARANAP